MNMRQSMMRGPVRSALLSAILFFTLLSNVARAQKAPPFSNDIMMDNHTYTFLMIDRLEYSSVNGPNALVWDGQGYIGKDLKKFWFKTEGEALTVEKEGEMEFQGLYSRAISPYFDVQAGLRYDIAYSQATSRSRGFAVMGLQGLAPYFFEMDGSIAVSQAGDISASFEAEYDLPITQRIFGQPRIATNIAVQEVEKWGVGSGFNNIQLGYRLRYEIRRQFAPYMGISWNRKLGKTADFTRDEGGRASTFGLVGGVRLWM